MAQTYAVGKNFLLQWNVEDQKLIITHRDNQDRIIWQSKGAGSPFLKVAQGSFSISEYQGNFDIKDDLGRITDDQTASQFFSEGPSRLRLDGQLCTSSAVMTEDGGSQRNANSSVQSASWPYCIVFSEETPHQLGLSIEVQQANKGIPSLTHIILDYAAEAEERIFGLGTQFTNLNLKGQRVPIMVAEQGVGRGLEPITSYLNDEAHGTGGNAFTTYFPLPYYVTSQARAFFLKNTEYSVFDFREDTSYQVYIAGTPSPSTTSAPLTMEATIIAAPSIPEVLAEFTQYNGRMDPLPEWSMKGAIVGLQGGSEVVRKHLATLEAAQVPLAGLWLQDWPGKRQDPFGSRVLWNWEVGTEYYQDWGGMLREFAGKGIRILSYINPYMALNVTNYRPNVRRNLYEEAKALGYLVLAPPSLSGGEQPQPYIQESGSEIFKFATLDLTNPAAVRWYSEIIQCNMLCVCKDREDGERLGCGEGGNGGIGVGGWMADFAEYLPTDAILHSGQSAESIHNDFPCLWAEVNRQAVREVGLDDDVVFFMRAGFLKSSRWSRCYWLGDQLTVWDEYDGLKSALIGMLSSGLSGNALSHSDLGGYTALNLTINGSPYTYQRSKELLLRWMEMSAFSDAMFRSHEGNRPLSNIQVYHDNGTLAHLSKFASIHSALADYKKTLMLEGQAKGWPLTRPLFWHYPQDPVVWNLTHQFMLGSDLLIAPVLDQRAEHVKVYLPRGEWIHLWTCEHVAAEEEKEGGLWMDEFPAPLGQPPVFFVKGALVGKQLQDRIGINCSSSSSSSSSFGGGKTDTAAATDLDVLATAVSATGTMSLTSNLSHHSYIIFVGLIGPLFLYILIKVSQRRRMLYVALEGGQVEQEQQRQEEVPILRSPRR